MQIVDFTFLIAILSLLILAIMLLIAAFKLREDFSAPKGKPAGGIIYAFTQGMSPGAKESASQHLLSYSAGIIFHIGIMAAFLSSVFTYLLIKGLASGLPSWLFSGLNLLMAVGMICGLGLLAKRIINPRLRFISNPDDYFSNILVNIFILVSLITNLSGTLAWINIMYLVEAVLFLYIPLGKLRHTVFFFATRIMFGHFYGHRGVLPHKTKLINK